MALLTITAALSLSEPGRAGTIRDDRVAPGINDPANPYIQLANEPQFDSVGRLSAFNGIYIGDDWVLTAAHVGLNIGVSQFNIGGNSYTVSERFLHPNWTGDFSNGFDIQLVRLDSNVMGVNPALIYAGRSELGQIGTFVGHGRSGTGLTGPNVPPGTKRAGTNVIDVFGTNSGMPNGIALGLNPLDPNNNILLADFDSPNLDTNSLSPFSVPTPTNLEYSIADRDSGGGAFMNFGGQWRLVGIHSFVANDTGRYGTILGDTRVSLHTAWITSVSGIETTPVPFQFHASHGLVALGILLGGDRILKLVLQSDVIKGLGKVVKALPKP
ncbi:trypsin-like serine protease [Thalassoporum mexicanum]|uniref:trypsin-like serine protease n=1 Tax=Thalassoporum mexicanum TaxID=3457544 RepID=UPI0005A080F8|nr:trypsin-like serine protease [Pseudanabaena sp. PCC 7367]